MSVAPTAARHRNKAYRLLAVLTLVLAQPVAASDRFGIGIEFGGVGFSRNDARIPGDDGTRYDVTRATDVEVVPFARLSGHWHIDERHSVHVVYAPLRITGTGTLAQDTRFEGESFQTGPVDGVYQFNAYKLTYRYTFAGRGSWRWGAGFTGVVRDAEIGLRQGTTTASNDNVGFVPTLHLTGRYRFDDRWALRLELDGLAGGPGRLYDVAVKLDRTLSDRWQLSAGYRTLEGGADTDSVYNFAWLHYAAAELRFRL